MHPQIVANLILLQLHLCEVVPNFWVLQSGQSQAIDLVSDLMNLSYDCCDRQLPGCSE